MPKSHPNRPVEHRPEETAASPLTEATGCEVAGGELLALARTVSVALIDEHVAACLLGGVAIALRCASARSPSPLAREFSDLDYATTRKAKLALSSVLAHHGFEPAERFNAMNGHTRLLFQTPAGVHVDVFVDKFEMCHALEFRGRLGPGQTTLPLADLLLTKLQVAQVTAKDIGDVTALLCDHELTSDETGINVVYLSKLLASDWGWWKTVTANLLLVDQMLATLGLAAEAEHRVRCRLHALDHAITDTPKTLRWRTRAALGERVAWRHTPEEPVRDAGAGQ